MTSQQEQEVVLRVANELVAQMRRLNITDEDEVYAIIGDVGAHHDLVDTLYPESDGWTGDEYGSALDAVESELGDKVLELLNGPRA